MGQHTGVHIANFFYNCLNELGLTEKIPGITLDNASVNTQFMVELEKKLLEDGILFSSADQHFRCFAHVINLAVQDVLIKLRLEHSIEDDEDDQDEADDVDDTILEMDFNDGEPEDSPVVKLRNLCKALKYSEKLTIDLQNFCKVVMKSMNSYHSTYQLGGIVLTACSQLD